MTPPLVACFIVFCSPIIVHADDENLWYRLGEYGGPALWSAGLGSSLVQDGRTGYDHSLRTGEGMLVSGAICEGLKALTHETRPNGSGRDSFPSLHATLSFEVAAAQSYYHPGQALIWYPLAALVSYSRIPAREHHWHDVVAGAALGFLVGHLAVSNRHGLFGDPSIDRLHSSNGITFSGRF